MMQKIGSRLSLVDFFQLTYLLFLLGILILSPIKNTYFFVTISIYFFLLLFLFYIISLRTKIKNRILYFWFYFLYPIIYLIVIFQSLYWLLPALNHSVLIENSYDPILYSIDSFLVTVHPVLWFSQFATPLITDIMYIIYSYYFILPLVLMFLLYYHKKYKEMQEAFFILSLSFYLSYIGYILIPARGPRFYLHLEPLQGIYLAGLLRNAINSIEPNKYDAFPSVHQLINILILILAFKYERKFFYFSIPIAVGITISLFYCQYHYVIDVIAGSLFAILFYLIGQKIWNHSNGSFKPQFDLVESFQET